MFKRYLSLAFVILFLFSFSACVNEKKNNNALDNEEKVRLVVTKNFGNISLYSQPVKLTPNYSVLELMEENLEISTAYNGGFVNSINGIESGYTNKDKKEKKDWFFYVNGVLSQVGSLDYIPKSNDVIQWDYHDWSSKYVSSLIGAFPFQFTNGYGDNIKETQIAYGNDLKEAADSINDYLATKGVAIKDNYDLNSFDIKSSGEHIIVVGLWEDIKSKEYISGLIKRGNKSGMFFQIDNTIKLHNYKNEIVLEEEKGCIITSFIRDYSNMSTLFIITGNDAESINKGIKILLEDTEKTNGLFSVLVTPDGKIINIPYEKEDE